MATRQQRLQKLKDLKNPDSVVEDVLSFLSSRIETHEVEPLVPEKGVDYFTDEDINEIADIVRGMVKDGVDGKDGSDGKDGVDGKDGEVGPQGPAGKDGETPNVDKIIKEILSKIPKPVDGVSPKVEDIIPLVIKELKLPDNKDLVSKDELVAFLKRGGFRGGGQAPTTINTVNTSSFLITAMSGVANVFCDATTQAVTVTLPTALNNTAIINVKKIDSTSNTVTISCYGAETIDSSSTKIIQFQNTSLQLVSDGLNWRII